MKAYLTKSTAIKGGVVFKGEVRDLDESTFRTLKAYGQAVAYDPDQHKAVDAVEAERLQVSASKRRASPGVASAPKKRAIRSS